MSLRRESNSRSSPYQGDVLPLNYSGEPLIKTQTDKGSVFICKDITLVEIGGQVLPSILAEQNCGQGGTCTPGGRSHLIYSQIHLTTLVPTLISGTFKS